MSESLQDVAYVSAEELAGNINDCFRSVAEIFPAGLKTKPAGTTEIICQLDGVGYIAASYLGKVSAGSDPRDNFNIRVAMVAADDERLGFYKDYALTYQSRRDDGPVFDKAPTIAADLDGCPAPLEILDFTITALTREYIERTSQTRPHLVLLKTD